MADEKGQDPKNSPVTGVFRPGRGNRLGPDEHHIGWDRAFENALEGGRAADTRCRSSSRRSSRSRIRDT